jgi:hypothetical protein
MAIKFLRDPYQSHKKYTNLGNHWHVFGYCKQRVLHTKLDIYVYILSNSNTNLKF